MSKRRETRQKLWARCREEKGRSVGGEKAQVMKMRDKQMVRSGLQELGNSLSYWEKKTMLIENRKETENSLSCWSWLAPNFLIYKWRNWGLEKESGWLKGRFWEELSAFSVYFLTFLFSRHESVLEDRSVASPYLNGPGQTYNTGGSWSREGKIFKIFSALLQSYRPTGAWSGCSTSRQTSSRGKAGCELVQIQGCDWVQSVGLLQLGQWVLTLFITLLFIPSIG